MYRAMIVDDDRWALEDMRKSFDFASHGFDLVGAFLNAEDALVVILEDPPDLVITDICMESVSGLEMIRACREKRLETVFILVSGYSDFEYVQEAFRNQVFFYLLKPLDSRAAREIMARVCQHLALQGRARGAPPADDSFGRILQYVQETYRDNYTLESLATRFFLHKNYLSELFPRRIGMTFTQYRHELRIQQAKRLIDGGHVNLLDIALSIGYDSASYFSRVFKQITGMRPQQYKQNRFRPSGRP